MDVTVEVDGKEEVVDLGIENTVPATDDISKEDAAEAGLDEREISDATKNGMIKEPTAEQKAAAEAAAAKKKADEEAAAKKDEKPLEPVKPVARPDLMNEEADPAKEAKRLEGFTPNEKALYWERKKAIKRAQRAEQAAGDKDKEIETLRKQLAEATKKSADENIFDENGKPKVPPAPAAEPNKEPTAEQVAARRKEIINVLVEQETEFKTVNPDFDAVFDLTTDIVDRVNDEAKMAELFPDPIQRRGVKSLVQEYIVSTQYPDHPKLPRLAPEIAYEIGNLHPKRQKSDNGAKPPVEPAAAADTAKPKEPKVEEPAPSSGAVSGGSRGNPKKITDMTEEEFLSMTDEKARSLKARFPREYEDLMRKFS